MCGWLKPIRVMKKLWIPGQEVASLLGKRQVRNDLPPNSTHFPFPWPFVQLQKKVLALGVRRSLIDKNGW